MYITSMHWLAFKYSYLTKVHVSASNMSCILKTFKALAKLYKNYVIAVLQ